MKKFIAIVAVAISFTACNSGASTQTPATDSTAVTVDSLKADTTVAHVDSTKVDTAKKAK